MKWTEWMNRKERTGDRRTAGPGTHTGECVLKFKQHWIQSCKYWEQPCGANAHWHCWWRTYLVCIIERSINEASDDRCLSHRLVAQKYLHKQRMTSDVLWVLAHFSMDRMGAFERERGEGNGVACQGKTDSDDEKLIHDHEWNRQECYEFISLSSRQREKTTTVSHKKENNKHTSTLSYQLGLWSCLRQRVLGFYHTVRHGSFSLLVSLLLFFSQLVSRVLTKIDASKKKIRRSSKLEFLDPGVEI